MKKEKAKHADKNLRPPFDDILVNIADYVTSNVKFSQLSLSTAIDCLMDSLACAFMALKHPECTRLIGPAIPGTFVPNGSRIPGTSLVLDPINAAFSIGTLIRWLDFNDTWLAAEWGHPSDNLGAILAIGDHLSRNEPNNPLRVKDILQSLIKAYEIQGILALENSLNAVGLDHVAFVKTASAAVCAQLLGGEQQDIINLLSHVWVDGQALRTYRHAPNVNSRKSWAAGDATRRALQLAWMVRLGETGLPSALSAKKWGFYDVSFNGKPFRQTNHFGSYVIENILFKVSHPAEFHAQTAIECAIEIHPLVKDNLDNIAEIKLTTHKSAIKIISKTGPLYNSADRDHCLQYMVAVALIFGDLNVNCYKDDFANNPKIDALREKMTVSESKKFSADYLDPDKRSIANAIQIIFKDGSSTENVNIDYPLGHKKRRKESKPFLLEKFNHAVENVFSKNQTEQIQAVFSDQDRLANMPVHIFMDHIAIIE